MQRVANKPLPFVRNDGQTDSKVRFHSRGLGGTIFFTPTEVVFSLLPPPANETQTSLRSQTDRKRHVEQRFSGSLEVIRLRFAGANPNPTLTNGDRLPGRLNYYIGKDPSKWRTNVPMYAGIVYKDLYTGIDLQYGGGEGRLKGTFTLKPGVNPAMIGWRYGGATSVRIDSAKGDLLIGLPGGRTLTERAPVAWQERNGQKVAVQVTYTVATDRRIGFTVGNYDRNLPLVIDPEIEYLSYMGGSGNEDAQAVAVDSNENMYLVGYTGSLFFPAGEGQTGTRPTSDVYVMKLEASLYDPTTANSYTTFIGGAGTDVGFGIALDVNNNAYVTGYTGSDDLPCSSWAFECGPTVNTATFVAKLDTIGEQSYLTYIGTQSGASGGYAIAVDSGGFAYIVGDTSGPFLGDQDFPLQQAVQPNYGGAFTDAFISKLNTNGSGLEYSTYLGGNDSDKAEGVAVDSTGSAYITGYTASTNFHEENALPTGRSAGIESFVVKLNPAGSYVYSTYVGWGANDYTHGIALDANNNAYIAGYNDGYTAHAIKLVFNGTNLSLGYRVSFYGYPLLWVFGIAVDSNGSAYLTGVTSVNASGSFSFTEEVSGTFGTIPTRPASRIDDDALVLKLNPTGTAVDDVAYLGGTSFERAWGGAVTSAGGVVYVVGHTHSTDLPVNEASTPPYQSEYHGGFYDVFVAKVSLQGGQQQQVGDRVVFSAQTPPGNLRDIYIVNSDGNNQQQLTSSTNANNFFPVGSPSGTHIAYLSTPTQAGQPTKLYLYNMTNNNNAPVSASHAVDPAYPPAWSTDGTEIAFVSNNDIYVVNVSGGAPLNITNAPADSNKSPSWSPYPALRHLTYSAKGPQTTPAPEIYRIEVTKTRFPITNNAANDTSPTWSTDFSQIAFVSNRRVANNTDIVTARGSGLGTAFNLTFNASNPNDPINAAQDSSPMWSPDVLRIAFTSTRIGNNIWWVNAYKQDNNGVYETRQVTNVTPLLSKGVWSPDGSKIVYASTNSIVVIDRDGTNFQPINNILDAYDPTWLPMSSAEISLELAKYGVNYQPGWTPTQLRQLLIGVQNVGKAFAVKRGQQPTSANGIASFILVMGTTPISFIRAAPPGGNGKPICQVNNSGNPRTITCDPFVIFTQYSVVHELGHVFDGRTDVPNNPNKKRFKAYVEETKSQTNQVIDNTGTSEENIMGDKYNTDEKKVFWTRGERGLGSGPKYPKGYPADLFTPFQQNTTCKELDASCNVFEEAAADLFLNWVYKQIGENTTFQNRTWIPGVPNPNSNVVCEETIAGCPDNANPGGILEAWINARMNTIFTQHGWN